VEQGVIKYLHEVFNKLIETYGFKIKTESNEGRFYLIEYTSTNFEIEIQQYFREFYISIFRTGKPNSAINLFNLLGYLRRAEGKVIESEFFRKEKDLDECLKKQLQFAASMIYENHTILNDFFFDENFDKRFSLFDAYWKNKHPEFYKTI
jgi:hypothetical protein